MDIRQQCTNQLRSFLDKVIKDFFSHITDDIGQALEKLDTSSSITQRPLFMHAILQFNRREAQLTQAFFNSIRERIQKAEPSSGDENVLVSMRELALVDEEELEDWLNLSGTINTLETEFQPQLTQLEQRYNAAVPQPLHRSCNPYGPEILCRTLQEALLELELNNPLRAVAYKTFQAALTRHYPPLFQELDNALPSSQVQVSTKVASHAGDTTATPSASQPAGQPAAEKPAEKLEEISDKLNQLLKQQQASPYSATQEPAEYNLDSILAAINDPQRTPAGRLPSQATQSPSAQSMMRLAKLMRQQEAALPWPMQHAMPAGVAATHPPGPGAEASLQDVLGVLDSMRVDPSAIAGKTASVGDQIVQRLAQMHGSATQVPPQYRQAIEMVSGLFKTASTQADPIPETEALIRRLEHPLLKLALTDPAFLESALHPARQVIDLLDQCAIAADDQGKFFDPKLHRTLTHLVERIRNNSEQDPVIYTKVRDTLEKILPPIQRIRTIRVARLQEACEARERIKTARSIALETLEQCLADKHVPEILMRLLDLGWRQHLILIDLRQGAYSSTWNEAQRVVERLLAWLAPDFQPTQDYPQEVRTLLTTLAVWLPQVNLDTTLVQDFLDELGVLLHSRVETPQRQTLRYVDAQKRAIRKSGQPDIEPHAELIDSLKVGDWWHFLLEGRWVPMQIIWLSDMKTTCAFANRSATNKVEVPIGELADQVANNLIKRSEDHNAPLSNRYEQTMVEELLVHMRHQAIHDPVTGLLNRKGMLSQMEARLQKATQADMQHTLCIVEFDQFRLIHNNCGADTVQQLSRSLAEAIRPHLEEEDLLAILHEDIFAVCLRRRTPADSEGAARNLLAQLQNFPFTYGADSYSIGVNIGLAHAGPDILQASDLLKRADSACIMSKSQGRNLLQVFEASNTRLQQEVSMMTWAGRIDQYLNGEGLFLRAQMVHPIDTTLGARPYYEILLGIRDSHGGMVNTQQFVMTVERLKRSHELDRWVIQKTFTWIREHRPQFDAIGGFSINLSAPSLGDQSLIDLLHEELQVGDIPADKLIFEVTETAAMGSYTQAQDFIKQLRLFGCKFSLDDFGSGYSSYAHLKRMQTDTLKIDGIFIKDLDKNTSDYAMVRSMHEVARSLGMKTVAEFVETPAILNMLREIGIDYAQGYAIHKPAPIEEIWP